MRQRISVSIDAELLAFGKEYADREYISVSSLLNQLLGKFKEKQEEKEELEAYISGKGSGQLEECRQGGGNREDEDSLQSSKPEEYISDEESRNWVNDAPVNSSRAYWHYHTTELQSAKCHPLYPSSLERKQTISYNSKMQNSTFNYSVMQNNAATHFWGCDVE